MSIIWFHLSTCQLLYLCLYSALSGVETVSHTGHCPKLKLNCMCNGEQESKCPTVGSIFSSTPLSVLVSRSQTQPSATQWEVSGQPTVQAFIKSLAVWILLLLLWIQLPSSPDTWCSWQTLVQWIDQTFRSHSRGLGLATWDCICLYLICQSVSSHLIHA